MEKNYGKKVSHADWFGDDDDQDNLLSAKGFEKAQERESRKSSSSSTKKKKNKNSESFSNKIFDSKEGHLLLELQKTYKGDSRFKLDKRFKGDVEFEKLPNNVKLVTKDIIKEGDQAQDREYEKIRDLDKEERRRKRREAKALAAETNEEGGLAVEDLGAEREKQKNILQELLPDEKILSKPAPKQKSFSNNYIVPRFDPTQLKACKTLIIQKEAKAPKEKLLKKGLIAPKIESGIDKARKNLLKANFLLGKMKEKTEERLGKLKKDGENDENDDGAVNPSDYSDSENPEVPKIKKIRKIDYKKWKTIINNNPGDIKSFSLFS